MNLSLFLFGSKTVEVSEVYGTALLDLCLLENINYTDFLLRDGKISFRISSFRAKRLIKLCKIRGIAIKIKEHRGLPALAWRYRRRAGLILGLVLIALMLWGAERFVWDLRITGNTTMTESEVREELRECGFGVGSYIPDFHAGELENRVLMNSDRISWISVYLDGTVARIQVIEHVPTPPAEDLSRPANLIAACDGQIELIELYRGNCVVTRGQAVKKGELLVSGLYDSQTSGYRYTRAAGNVLARTEKQIQIEIPLSYLEKRYEKAKNSEVFILFFNYSLKVFKCNGNATDYCDIIEEEIGFDGIGLPNLPFGILTKKIIPYTEVCVTRTHEAALELAYAELEHRLLAMSEDTQILSKRIKTELTDQSLILECTVSCIENIAVQSEFDIIE